MRHTLFTYYYQNSSGELQEQIINSNSLITVIHSINTGEVILLAIKGDDGFRIVITPYNKIQKTTGKITEKKQTLLNKARYSQCVNITDLYSGVAGLHY